MFERRFCQPEFCHGSELEIFIKKQPMAEHTHKDPHRAEVEVAEVCNFLEVLTHSYDFLKRLIERKSLLRLS